MHRILVVEDEEAVASALERFLRRHAEARVLLDPLRFEDELDAFSPTMVISDLNMPGRNGLEVLAAARRLRPQVTRVLLSGSLHSVSPSMLALVTPCLFLSKPWNSAELLEELGLATR